jgi:Amt family ammonium transporter
MPVPNLSEAATVACLVFIFLVPFAAAGLSLINTGLGRSRSASHMMMTSLCALSVAAIAYFVFGFAWQGFAGGEGHILVIAGKGWNWIGGQPFFFRRLPLDGAPTSLVALLGIFSVALAALIPLGSGADRLKLRAACASTAVLGAWTYPLFAHWVWGGGWLDRCWWGVNNSCCGGTLGAVSGVDFGTAQRKIFAGQHGTRHSWS